MGRYTGPKARINRRLGAAIFESAGALKAFDRRPSAPGMHPAPRKLSKYGEAMREKQKIKYYYGLSERQLRRMFDKARHKAGNSGENLLVACERRLDSVVRLAGLAKTRPQARQGIAHGHFALNGVTTDIPSAMVRPGDVVAVRRRGGLVDLYAEVVEANDGQCADWLSLNASTLEATVLRLPGFEDVTLPVDVAIVVELLSR